MKIAIAGKGGVGKTTISATLARLLGRDGEKVFAIDADPNTNLSISLGVPRQISDTFTPIIEMKQLIEERTGAAPGSMGNYFKLNPRVDDLPDRFKYEYKGVMFLLTGALREPSSGCYCPENSLLKALLMNMILGRDETVILDMEAGFEHITRGTAQAFDAMIIVVEPSARTMLTAGRIQKLSEKIGIKNILYIGNKVQSDEDAQFLKDETKNARLIGMISMSDEIRKADRNGTAPFDSCPTLVGEIERIRASIFKQIS